MDKKYVLDLIKLLFADTPMPPPENVMMAGDAVLSDEPSGDFWYVMKDFSGKTWQDLTYEDIRTGHDALGMMTPEGFRYYLPAYLSLIIDEPEKADIEVGKTISILTPNPKEWGALEGFETRISLLPTKERVAVAYFFEYFRRLEPENNISYTPFPDELTYYWQKYYPFTPRIDDFDFLRELKPLSATSSTRKESLIQEIHKAFADVAISVGDRFTMQHRPKDIYWTTLDEVSLCLFLKGKTWQSLNLSEVNDLSGTLKIMTSKAFTYYIAGFMSVIINEPDQVFPCTLKAIVWALSPPPYGTTSKENFDERIRSFTQDQRFCIADFFNYLRFTEYYLSSFSGPESYQRLTCFWDSDECYRAFKATKETYHLKPGDIQQ